MSALYGSFIAEQGDPLAPLPLQYADYAAWQRRWLASGQLEKQGAFWQTNLSGAPTHRKPEAIALTFDGQRLSYAELNARANRLAHYLQARGVGPDRLVALCAERGIEMVVAERKQVVYAWNATERDYPIEQCIHQLFEAQVDRKPEAIALTFDGQRLSYAELNARANRLAHYLPGRGRRGQRSDGAIGRGQTGGERADAGRRGSRQRSDRAGGRAQAGRSRRGQRSDGAIGGRQPGGQRIDAA
ncbi:AMP-binding protein, partial [Burkholderia pseudomallei]|uniref:AMP-binding protein n=1 Tax=Burkholderia pseudomallei TaxID=28450 RepID=UPI00235E8445